MSEQKQLDRGYAAKDERALFSPSRLGEALVASYHEMGLANLWQPDLRCEHAWVAAGELHAWFLIHGGVLPTFLASVFSLDVPACRSRDSLWSCQSRGCATIEGCNIINATIGRGRCYQVHVHACRGIIERNIAAVAAGRQAKQAVLEDAVQHFRADYITATAKQGARLGAPSGAFISGCTA